MKIMLKRFEVENFRGFSGKWVLNLESAQYSFNQSVVYNGLVKNALVYGINGAGVSHDYVAYVHGYDQTRSLALIEVKNIFSLYYYLI